MSNCCIPFSDADRQFADTHTQRYHVFFFFLRNIIYDYLYPIEYSYRMVDYINAHYGNLSMSPTMVGYKLLLLLLLLLLHIWINSYGYKSTLLVNTHIITSYHRCEFC